MGYFTIETGKYPREFYQMDGETRAQAIERHEKGELEHFKEFDAIARKLGIPFVLRCLPRQASKEAVTASLKAGDYHLNKIPLAYWDGAAGGLRPYQGHPLAVSFDGGKCKYIASLSQRVCLLKHVARHYLTGDIEQ